MRASLISQHLSRRTTVERLNSLLRKFSRLPKAQFRGLVAFVSKNGLRKIEPSLRRFLGAGGSMFWIVGVDLRGTGREAIAFLYALKRRYPTQVDARIFTVGDNRRIFHPKVYWFDAKDSRTIVLGSSNATPGGLEHNFEASLEIELEPVADGELLEAFDRLWISYASPLPPLTEANLIEIGREVIAVYRLTDHPPTAIRPSRTHFEACLRRPDRDGCADAGGAEEDGPLAVSC
jgi:HKD family nuclease